MQKRAIRTREQILLAAAEVFEAKGYSGARMDDIAARPKMSKGALYFHFSSKDALADAIVNEYRDLWGSLIAELRAGCPRAMHLLFALSWRLTSRFPDDVLMRAGTRLALERSLVSPSVRTLFQTWAKHLKMLLAEARTQGDLAPDVDVEPVAGFLVSAFTGCQHVFAAVGDHEDLQRCVRMMWWSVLPGLVEADQLAEMRALLMTRLSGDPVPAAVTPGAG